MPPKHAKASSSKAIIRTGPKDVTVHPSRQGKRTREQAEKPTTARALVLRNGKHGAMGTGELVTTNKITGREKLDLLAAELIRQLEQAIMTPFRLEQCMKIAESQFGLYRDDIVNLRDPEIFRDIIDAELIVRTRPGVEPRRNASNVARVIGTRVHNSFMLASAWKIVSDTFNTLARGGLTDRNIKMKLKNEPALRTRYLVLFDMVNTLVEMSHSKLSVLATTAPHYAPFFKPKPTELSAPGEQEVVFEWGNKNLRSITESFLDSIVIELCFPRAPYPRAVLYQLLKDCIDESPHEAKRFSQAMWNAMGDLSVSVELQTLLEAPLFGSEGEAWRKEPRAMPEEFEKWIDAQFFSAKASGEIGNWKDMVFPLGSTKKKDVLQNIWKAMNINYQNVSGHDIDTLWQLDGALQYTPQWTAYYIPQLAEASDEDDEEDYMPRLSVKDKKKKPLVLMGPSDDDSGGSMPALQSVSNSSDDDLSEISSDEEDYDDDYETDESGYNTEEEDDVRDMLREAMDAGHEVDWFDTTGARPEIDPLQSEEKKGNPFLKMLGSLRGRMFNSSPKLKVETQRTEPRPGVRGAFRATPSGVPKAAPTGPPPKPGTSKAQPTATQADTVKSQKTTLEEVEDEDAVPSASKKKKKKKPKKKKAAAGAGGEREGPELASPASPRSPAVPPLMPTSPKIPTSPKAKNAPVVTPVSPSRPSFGASTSTLGVPFETAQPQSGHSYLKQLDSDFQQKAKIKSRPDHASLFSNQDNDKSSGKGGFFSKLTRSVKGKGEADHGNKNPKNTWFQKLGKKARETMHQLLNTSEVAGKAAAPLKWEAFLRLMREMGFDYDPSTAGSSVRFDPPSKKDTPITIHKPHPKTTLDPIMVKAIAKRLKRYYGWEIEDFIKATNEAAANASP